MPWLERYPDCRGEKLHRVSWLNQVFWFQGVYALGALSLCLLGNSFNCPGQLRKSVNKPFTLPNTLNEECARISISTITISLPLNPLSQDLTVQSTHKDKVRRSERGKRERKERDLFSCQDRTVNLKRTRIQSWREQKAQRAEEKRWRRLRECQRIQSPWQPLMQRMRREQLDRGCGKLYSLTASPGIPAPNVRNWRNIWPYCLGMVKYISC